MSTSSELRVSFDPEIFGTTEDYKGKVVLWPDLKFVDGSMKLDDRKTGNGLKNEARYVEMLQEHAMNNDNGGSDFWKLPDADTSTAISMQLFEEGKPVSQTMDLKLRDDDKKHFKDLQRWVEKQFAPTQRTKVCDTVKALVARFEVIGIEIPEPDMKSRSLKAICTRLLDYFEESGIWDGVDDEGQEDIRPS